MSGEQDESGVLEARASLTMGTMSTPRGGPRVRRSAFRRPQNQSIYRISNNYDPWANGRITWTKAGEETLNQMLSTATQPPIQGFWQNLRPGAKEIVHTWFETNEPLHEKKNDRPIVSAFRDLIHGYNHVMTGWMNSLRTAAELNKHLGQERTRVETLTEENQNLLRQTRELRHTVVRNGEFMETLEMKNREHEDRIGDLTQQLKIKQVENRRLTQTLNSRRSQQTTPGGTVIDDGRDGHRGTTWSEDIGRKERDDYLFNITQANDRADAAESRNRELEAAIARLRAGQEVVNQAGDSVTSTGVGAGSASAAAIALKATEEKYQDWVGELKNENSGLKTENESLKKTNEGLETAIQALATRNDETLRQEKEKRQADCQELQGMLAKQRSVMAGKLQKTTQDLGDCQETYDKLKRRAAEYEKKIRRLEIDNDNGINRLRRQVDSINESVKKLIPKLNKLDQWVNQASAARDQYLESVEKAQPILKKADKLKKTQTSSQEIVRGLADLVTSAEKVRESHEPTLKEAKETRDGTRETIKDLAGLNEMLLGWRSRVRSGLGSTTALRHEGGMIASTLERLEHQHREQQCAQKDASDADTLGGRLRSQHITPSKTQKEERPPTAKPAHTERVSEAALARRRDRVPQRPPPTLVFVDEPVRDTPVAVRGDEKDKKPEFETPPNNYPFEHDITSSKRGRIHAANAPNPEEASEPRERHSSEEGRPPSSVEPRSPGEPRSPEAASKSPEAPKSHEKPPNQTSSASSPLSPPGSDEQSVLDDGLDSNELEILEGFIKISEIIRRVSDEDNRKPDNSFLAALLRRDQQEMKDALLRIFNVTGFPPQDILGPVGREDHRLFWVCRAYKEFEFNAAKEKFDEAAALKWLEYCERHINLQIREREGSPEAALSIASERHEEARQLRTKYDELETELLGAKLSAEEEFYVLSCVKRHLDSGKGAGQIEELIWGIAPVIDREAKLREVTLELSKWVKEYSEWVEAVLVPQYIDPLKAVIQTLKNKIADVNDFDDKILLEARIKRLRLLIRHNYIEELPLKDTFKSPLETVTANILVNKDVIEAQEETRRNRIESLIREKAMELYSTYSHSKHAESACFCSLLKYFAPKVYYGAVRDGCCGQGRMVSPIKEGTNVDTQPVRPESRPAPGSPSSLRRGRRVCQGHHGHGLLSASATLPTVICHVLTTLLWIILYVLSTPLDIYFALLFIFTTPFNIVSCNFTWIKYYLTYLHWYFFPKNYAENYLPTASFSPPTAPSTKAPFSPATPFRPPAPSQASTPSFAPSLDDFSPAKIPGGAGPNPIDSFLGDEDEISAIPQFDGAGDSLAPPDRRPSIDMFAFRPSPAPSVKSDDQPTRPPPPEKPKPFRLSAHTASPASLVISLSIITTIFSSVLYLALDQERRIWLSNNHWRRAFVNDMLEPFGTRETRSAAWMDWGVVAFPVNAVIRGLNGVLLRWVPRGWSLVPWDTDRAVVTLLFGGPTLS
ncbi:hypothetical protein QBC36DRAFT_360602 [Triangularia setosa]|uniref:Uncharacterized protein n=1 Tax=Triangularia setosa TaxID=2587417 RepID=A0AAN6W0F5_9PEZI|nr:hypothetical protein QBC36DRAFT_360602 [Podospora setosa]